MRCGFEKSFQKQVVDVDSDVDVTEGQIRRTGELETVRFLTLVNTGAILFCRPVQKDGPAFLEKGKECFPLRNDRVEGPIVETILLAEKLNQASVKWIRDTLSPIVATQEHVQQIGRFSDELRCNLKNMPQNEFLCGVIA